VEQGVIAGTWEPGFEKVVEYFGQQLVDGGRGGAACCVYHRGHPVVDVWGGVTNARGDEWRPDSLCLAFSTTKLVTATALHRCVDLGLLEYDDLVARHWPEFARGGKDAITVRQVLCHEAGLHALRKWIDSPDELVDWPAVIEAIERMEPEFPPGSANAYQAVTFGYLVGELVQRVTGSTFGRFVRQELAEPLGLDGLLVGVPDDERARGVEMTDLPVPEGRESEAGRMIPADLDVDPETPTKLLAPRGFDAFIRTPRALDGPIPAANGTFTARSVARLCAALANHGELDGARILTPGTLARATEIQNDRADLVTGFPMMWRLGFHVVYTTAGGVLPGAFGHNGFGGSGAWVDPGRELAICFIPSALGNGLAFDMRFLKLGGRAVRAVDALAS